MTRLSFLLFLTGLLMLIGVNGMAQDIDKGPFRDTRPDTWVAMDDLGRTVPGFDECGAPRDRIVGIFYFLWQEDIPNTKVHDITKLLAADADNPDWGPPGAFHWWSQPHMGYYIMDDEFVIRKHAQMLVDAGVDAIFFDVTNAVTYDHNFLTICKVFREMREAGQATPQISFLLNSGAQNVARHLYNNFYAKNLYPELWFKWLGKPLILASDEGLDDELKNYFTLRQSWAWTDPNGWFGNGKDKWPWLDNCPQNYGWHEPGVPEHVSVTVAQHSTSNIGRSFQNGRQPAPEDQQSDIGLCFTEQWERALEIDPEFVFITGWNEWIAQRFLSDGNAYMLG